MEINNSIGAAGIGNFSILPIRVTDGLGLTNVTSIDRGIRLAADSGAKMINVSFGFNNDANYATLDAAAAYARSLGSLVFISAGNSNSELTFSDWTNLIFVGGTNPTDGLWSAASATAAVGGRISISLPRPKTSLPPILLCRPTVMAW